MYTPDTILAHVGINDVLNDKSQWNTVNLLSNIKYKVSKCHNFYLVWFISQKYIVLTSMKNLVIEILEELSKADASTMNLSISSSDLLRKMWI